MNLFKGLEKFGLKTEGTENLFEDVYKRQPLILSLMASHLRQTNF